MLAKSSAQQVYQFTSRLIGLVYIIAIFPLFFQIKGLIGANGLQPAHQLLSSAYSTEGLGAFLRFPSLFWLYPSDWILYLLVSGGVAGGMLLMVNKFAFFGSLLSWVCFVSISVVGGDFLVIIIDLFLAEAGFLLVLLHWGKWIKGYVPRIAHVGFLFLNFRLWFSMGMVKFYFPGSTWTDFTFFENFFPFQPMPTPLAFVFWKFPHWTHAVGEFWLLISQLVFPFFVWGGKKMRVLAFLSFLTTSVLIMLCGNYGYFNILSIVVALPLLPDSIFSRQLVIPTTNNGNSLPNVFHQNIFLTVASIPLVMQVIYTIALFDPKPPGYQNHFNQVFLYKRFEAMPFSVFTAIFKPFVYVRACNPYGVFKSIPRFRIELRLLGSIDGKHWETYRFKYVPSANTQSLKFFAPYYPRLDHLLFYESLDAGGYNFNLLNPYYTRNNVWTNRFLTLLFENDKELTKLLALNPFAGKQAPLYIQCEAHTLRFSPTGTMSSAWEGELLWVLFTVTPNEVPHTPLLPASFIYSKFE